MINSAIVVAWYYYNSSSGDARNNYAGFIHRI